MKKIKKIITYILTCSILISPCSIFASNSYTNYLEKLKQNQEKQFDKLYKNANSSYGLNWYLLKYEIEKEEKQEILLQLLIKSTHEQNNKKMKILLSEIQKHNNTLLQNHPYTSLIVGLSAGLGTGAVIGTVVLFGTLISLLIDSGFGR